METKSKVEGLEFVITGPSYDVWSWSRNLVWGKLVLTHYSKPIHWLFFLIGDPGPQRSQWYFSFQLLPYMEQLVQAYFSTTRGLNP